MVPNEHRYWGLAVLTSTVPQSCCCPKAVKYVPGEHIVQVLAVVDPEPVLYVPAAHRVHCEAPVPEV